MKFLGLPALFALLCLTPPCSASESATSETQIDLSSEAKPRETKFNFRINPEGLLYQVWGAGVDINLTRYFAIGSSFNYFVGSSRRAESSVYQSLLSFTGFLGGNCFENSWYGRISLGYVWINSSRTTVIPREYSGTYGASLFKASVGRSWQIYKALNAGAGIGVSESFGKTQYVLRSESGLSLSRDAPISQKFRPLLEIYLAYAF